MKQMNPIASRKQILPKTWGNLKYNSCFSHQVRIQIGQHLDFYLMRPQPETQWSCSQTPGPLADNKMYVVLSYQVCPNLLHSQR